MGYHMHIENVNLMGYHMHIENVNLMLVIIHVTLLKLLLYTHLKLVIIHDTPQFYNNLNLLDIDTPLLYTYITYIKVPKTNETYMMIEKVQFI